MSNVEPEAWGGSRRGDTQLLGVTALGAVLAGPRAQALRPL
jgi:hypothetical protein